MAKITASDLAGMDAHDRVAGLPHLLRRLAGAPRALWRTLLQTTEMLSDAGHTGPAWRDDSEIPNPYAGAGPGEPSALREERGERPREP